MSVKATVAIVLQNLPLLNGNTTDSFHIILFGTINISRNEFFEASKNFPLNESKHYYVCNVTSNQHLYLFIIDFLIKIKFFLQIIHSLDSTVNQMRQQNNMQIMKNIEQIMTIDDSLNRFLNLKITTSKFPLYPSMPGP